METSSASRLTLENLEAWAPSQQIIDEVERNPSRGRLEIVFSKIAEERPFASIKEVLVKTAAAIDKGKEIILICMSEVYLGGVMLDIAGPPLNAPSDFSSYLPNPSSATCAEAGPVIPVRFANSSNFPVAAGITLMSNERGPDNLEHIIVDSTDVIGKLPLLSICLYIRWLIRFHSEEFERYMRRASACLSSASKAAYEADRMYQPGLEMSYLYLPMPSAEVVKVLNLLLYHILVCVP